VVIRIIRIAVVSGRVNRTDCLPVANVTQVEPNNDYRAGDKEKHIYEINGKNGKKEGNRTQISK